MQLVKLKDSGPCWQREKGSFQQENPHSSAALPSITPLLTSERTARQNADPEGEHASCWR